MASLTGAEKAIIEVARKSAVDAGFGEGAIKQALKSPSFLDKVKGALHKGKTAATGAAAVAPEAGEALNWKGKTRQFANKKVGGTGLRKGLIAQWMLQSLEKAGKSLDQSLVGRKQLADTERFAKAEQEARAKSSQVRQQVGALPPEQQQVFQDEYKKLFASLAGGKSEDLVFRARQQAALSQIVLDRLMGQSTPEQEASLAMLRRPDIVKRLGEASTGLSEVEMYRTGTRFGRIMGNAQGKLSAKDQSTAELIGGRVWRSLVHPLATLKRGLWDEEDFFPANQPESDEAARGIRGTAQQFFGPKATINDTPSSKNVLGTGTGTSEKQGLGGAGRTFEDFTKAALTAAGFGTPEAKAYHYDPWGQTGGNAPYLAALAGGGAALNPRIVGGRAPEMRDIRGLHQGTQQSQKAYAAELDAQGQAMARNAMAPAGPAYAAYQKGEGLRQGLQVQQRQVDQRERVNFERTVYNRESQLLGKQYADGTIDEKAHNIGQTKLVDRFASVLRPTVEEEELALQQGG